MKIYIAGPMSGLRDCNRPEFNRVADILTKNGDVVLNPATLPDGLSQADYMAICIAMLQRCDAILMLNGWQGSEGAKAEHALPERVDWGDMPQLLIDAMNSIAKCNLDKKAIREIEAERAR
ncbi:DUF4406 domain-containing protein [Providencia sneebia]|uniref:Nucleoside 2-deoxyribosyltransferase n=1 Tax=Providencia sneebia DSM 19967 TaxID=1141660 RepID=K8W5A6_9GAMM|nr:hypothetical protein OO7_12389 [Providencia sneebia DSM 19967]